MTAIVTWIKNNIMLAALIAIGVVFLLLSRTGKRLFSGRRRVVHHRIKSLSAPRTRIRRFSRKMRKPIPRSVGMQKAAGKGYPKVGGGYIPFKHNKDGSIKKAAFVSGTVAAKRRMAQLRRAR